MNIYFACSITGGREFEADYQEIVAALTADVYERDVHWIKNCDVLIAEVSVPSHGVGYEIGFALNIGKPVLCLYQNTRRVSKMITGNSDPKLSALAYANIKEAISHARFFLVRQ
jgi:nucleoside 2-deoxyribosyltransferase